MNPKTKKPPAATPGGSENPDDNAQRLPHQRLVSNTEVERLRNSNQRIEALLAKLQSVFDWLSPQQGVDEHR